MSWIFDHIMTLGEKTAVSSGKIGFMDQAASTTAQYRSLLHFSHFYCFSIVTFSPFHHNRRISWLQILSQPPPSIPG